MDETYGKLNSLAPIKERAKEYLEPTRVSPRFISTTLGVLINFFVGDIDECGGTCTEDRAGKPDWRKIHPRRKGMRRLHFPCVCVRVCALCVHHFFVVFIIHRKKKSSFHNFF